MANEVRTLFIIFKDKDEIYSNLLRKLVEENDDNAETGEGVGTEDGSVNIIAWSEKQWIAQKETIATTEKILFLGNVKGTEHLIPLIDEKYNQFGIRYGWAGNQAVIYADSKLLKNKKEYNIFLSEIKSKTNVESMQKEKKIGFNKKTVFKSFGALFLPLGWPILAGSLIKDVFDDKKLVRNQQYMLGIFEIYRNHLKEFMKY